MSHNFWGGGGNTMPPPQLAPNTQYSLTLPSNTSRQRLQPHRDREAQTPWSKALAAEDTANPQVLPRAHVLPGFIQKHNIHIFLRQNGHNSWKYFLSIYK